MIRMNEESGQVIIPYVTIERVVEVLNVIYKKGNKEMTIEDLSSPWEQAKAALIMLHPLSALLG